MSTATASATTSRQAKPGSSESAAVLAELRELLEQATPADSQNAANRRAEKRLEADVRRYFERLEKALPLSKISALYNRLVED